MALEIRVVISSRMWDTSELHPEHFGLFPSTHEHHHIFPTADDDAWHHLLESLCLDDFRPGCKILSVTHHQTQHSGIKGFGFFQED